MSDLNLITPKQFYELLNETLDYPIGRDKIYSMVQKKGFPSVKIGSRYFIFKDMVADWMMKQKSLSV